MESFAIPFERVAGGKSELIAALVNAAQEIRLSAVPSPKEHQLLEAIVESLLEWKRRIQLDCKNKNLNMFQTAEAMEQVQQGINMCVLKLRTIHELLSLESALVQPEEAPQQIRIQQIQQLLFIAQEREVRPDCPESVPQAPKREEESVRSDGKVIPPRCYYCQERHFIYRCRQYQGLTPKRRLEFAQQQHLCLNCFHYRHEINYCPKPPRCLFCHGKHHAELHSALVEEH
ncbi:uncharacterized protein LOC134288125 [Aedes albopictus]|uniref:C3H1-type domain-containing protein n=1 Tax=Aedes albopictus TaxID=7160 RepID=A0ABM1YPU1_AEDAL